MTDEEKRQVELGRGFSARAIAAIVRERLSDQTPTHADLCEFENVIADLRREAREREAAASALKLRGRGWIASVNK